MSNLAALYDLVASLTNEYDPENPSYSPTRQDEEYDPDLGQTTNNPQIAQYEFPKYQEYDPRLTQYENYDMEPKLQEYQDYDQRTLPRYREYDETVSKQTYSKKQFNKRNRDNKMIESDNFKRHKQEEEWTAFVYNIAFTISESELKSIFEEQIKIKKFKLVDQKNDQGKMCKRFAFVTVSSQNDFDILMNFHNIKIDGRNMFVRQQQQR
jgi:RNA recognition motif. (a.k.a. RRM, RBD, or RNP domain)